MYTRRGWARRPREGRGGRRGEKDPSGKGSNLGVSVYAPVVPRVATERGKMEDGAHPLSPSKNGPRMGPLRASRASYEIYKHASALQIIHRCLCVCVFFSFFRAVERSIRQRLGPLGPGTRALDAAGRAAHTPRRRKHVVISSSRILRGPLGPARNRPFVSA